MKANPGIAPPSRHGRLARARGIAPEVPAAVVVGPARIELVFSAARHDLFACLILAPVHPEQIKLCYALGRGDWRDNVALAKRWGVWAVLASEAWADGQLADGEPRPKGVGIAFLG